MQVIEFNVRNQRLTRYTAGIVAEGSYKYLKFKFNLRSEDWLTVGTRIANFSYRGRSYPAPLDANNLCEVPSEVLHTPEFTVSLYGGGITTNAVRIPVEKNNMYHDFTDPSYDEVLNKLSAIVDTKADNIVYNEEDKTVQLESNGVPIGNAVEIHDCGIENFVVDENDNITVTLTDGRVLDLGQIVGASSVTFIPHIDERKILTWTNDGGLENPDPVDLNPFDEWSEDGDEISEYIWEDE